MEDKVPLSSEELKQRKLWFEQYIEKLESHSVVQKPEGNSCYACPCCGYKTLSERGGYDICPICFWEDDGQDEEDADTVRGGPNGALSLTLARTNYKTCGACEQRFMSKVRAPRPEEK